MSYPKVDANSQKVCFFQTVWQSRAEAAFCGEKKKRIRQIVDWCNQFSLGQLLFYFFKEKNKDSVFFLRLAQSSLCYFNDQQTYGI